MVKHPWFFLFGIILGPFLIGVDLLAIGVAIDPMRKELSIDIATLQWFITAFGIGNASFLVTSGKLADLYGKKRMLIIGALIFMISSGCIAFSHSALMITLMRLIQGASGGILATIAIAVIMSVYAPDERTKWIAALIGVSGLGTALGPVIGGFLVQYFSWRAIFLINLPLGLIGLLFLYLYVPKLPLTKKPGEKLDLIGVVLFTAALSLFTIGITQGNNWGWTHQKTVLALAGFIVLLSVFILYERKCSQPLIDFALFKIRNFFAANLSGSILYFTLTAWILLYGIYLQKAEGMNAVDAGVLMLPFGLALMILSTQIGKLSKRFGAKKLIVFGYVLSAVSFFGQAAFASNNGALATFFALYGCGFMLVNANTIPAALEFMPVDKAGIASGKSLMIRWLGGAIGSGVIASVFVANSSGFEGSIQQSYRHGLSISLMILGFLCFSALAVNIFFLKQKEKA